MKASGILSFATLATSAMAAPLVGGLLDTVGNVAAGVPIVGPILSQVDAEALIAKLPVGDALDKIVAGLPLDGAVSNVGEVKEKITSSEGVITLVSGVVDKVKGQSDLIEVVLSKFKAGEIEKADADAQVIDLVEGIQIDITEIVTSLTASVGIPVADGDVDRVLVLVEVLVKQLTTTVKSIVTILGLRPQLTSLLHSVFTLVANVLTLLIGLLTGLLPGLVAGLAPLLAGLGNGVLAPILTPVVALVAGIAGV